MTDPRIKQLEKDIENELNTSKSKYAFTGFGRSTDNMTASAKTEKEGTNLMGGLMTVLRAEENYKRALKAYQANPNSKGLGEALGDAQEWLNYANKKFSELKTKQSLRLKKLSEDILSSGGKLSIQMRYNNAFRKFKSRPSGRNFLRLKSVSQPRTKVYQPGKERKENTIPQRKLTSILANKNRFGARTLQGLKTK